MDRCVDAAAPDPQYAPALHMMGIVAARMGDQGLAITFVERAHQIEPDYREYPALLAYLCASVGRISDALYYAKLTRPSSRPIPWAAADAGRTADGAGDLRQCRHIDALAPGRRGFHSGKFADAAQTAEAELRINPENLPHAGDARRAPGMRSASSMWRAVICSRRRGCSPIRRPALRCMGDVLLDLGEHDQALANHRTALTLEAEDDSAAAAHVLSPIALADGWQPRCHRHAGRRTERACQPAAQSGDARRRPRPISAFSGISATRVRWSISSCRCSSI